MKKPSLNALLIIIVHLPVEAKLVLNALQEDSLYLTTKNKDIAASVASGRSNFSFGGGGGGGGRDFEHKPEIIENAYWGNPVVSFPTPEYPNRSSSVAVLFTGFLRIAGRSHLLELQVTLWRP